MSELRSLLVVDGNVVQRLRTVACCRESGVPVIRQAGSGAEALAVLASLVRPPDLLIVDLDMQDMDGVELIEQLHTRGISAPLIVASGLEVSLIQSVEAVARNLGLSVVAGMRQPLDLAQLAALLERFVPVQAAARMATPCEDAPAIRTDALSRAIAEGDIKVHYQPKIDMRTGEVQGVEALARWQPRGAASVRPDRFIALAEREGLIHDLTLAVMHQAMAQAADWNAQGLKLSLAINLSPMLLDQPSLVQKITGLVHQHALRADQLVLEITETSLIDVMGAAPGVLARLRLKGFGLSIDDYGTGFSSMRQLASIPFTELKIDRSLVHGAHQRNNLRVILRSALEMARQLDLVTVAEGIETLEDWRLLQECGCSLGQGYLIARPMSAGEIAGWMVAHRARQDWFRGTGGRPA